MGCGELALTHGGGGHGWEVKLMGMAGRDRDDGDEGLGLAHHDFGNSPCVATHAGKAW